MNYINWLLLTVCLLASSTQSWANSKEPEWVLLDTATLSLSSEKSHISLKKIVSRRDFSHIKLVCVQGEVDIRSLSLKMTTGEARTYQTFNLLTKGASTRELSLPGTRQSNLTRFTVTYANWDAKTAGNLGGDNLTKLEIWGQKIPPAPAKKSTQP
ncbi:hypothetical protein [Vibrio olivae]|uniref:DUF2541 family protein n=1 Tax=Vibrio olivae TaxID=1243002 RepID=A0ABV5HQ58_9VIBR